MKDIEIIVGSTYQKGNNYMCHLYRYSNIIPISHATCAIAKIVKQYNESKCEYTHRQKDEWRQKYL